MARFYVTSTDAGSGYPGTAPYPADLMDVTAESAHTPANAGSTIGYTVPAAASTHGVLILTSAEAADLYPSADWPTSGYGWSIDVATAAASTSWTATFGRMPDPAISLGGFRSNTHTTASQSGTGIKTATGITIALNAASNRQASDVLGFSFNFDNSGGMMTGDAWAMRVSDSESWLESLAGQSVPVAQVSQVNTAQVHTRNKRKTLGQARR